MSFMQNEAQTIDDQQLYKAVLHDTMEPMAGVF